MVTQSGLLHRKHPKSPELLLLAPQEFYKNPDPIPYLIHYPIPYPIPCPNPLPFCLPITLFLTLVQLIPYPSLLPS